MASKIMHDLWKCCGGGLGDGLKLSYVKPHQPTYNDCKGLWKKERRLKTITSDLDPT